MPVHAIAVTRDNQVATITMLPFGANAEGAGNLHAELAAAFAELRADDDVRVVVLTGCGDTFLVPGPSDAYETGTLTEMVTDPTRAWTIFSGVVRCHETMAEMEKPIVARVKGDEIGFGQSLG